MREGWRRCDDCGVELEPGIRCGCPDEGEEHMREKRGPVDIDFENPGVVMSHMKRIPIDTDEKYAAVIKVVEGLHEHRGIECGVETDKVTGARGDLECYETLAHRVCNGMTLAEIIKATNDELDDRYPETRA